MRIYSRNTLEVFVSPKVSGDQWNLFCAPKTLIWTNLPWQVGNNKVHMLNTRIFAISATLAMLTMLVSVPAIANAAKPATHICIAPISSKGDCTRLAASFTGTVNSILSVYVSFADKIPFNSYDVIVATNQAFLNPVSAELVGSSILQGSVIKYCVNGVDEIGSGCSSQDTYGTVEFFIGSTSFTGAHHLSSGPLFQVDFQVVAIPSSPITIGFQTGCSPSSLPDGTTCVLVANGGTSPLPVAFAETATFS